MSDALLGTIWRSLAAAVKQRSPFTLMQLATIGEDGAPKLRTIVLRRFDEETGSLSFIADLRSPKVREIKANPLVSLAAFDGGNAVQLRIDGRAAIIEDETQKRAFWNSLRPHTHILFRSPLPPGTALAFPQDAAFGNADPEAAYAQFCLIEIALTHLEWLDLSSEQHTRCSFRRGTEGWAGTWVVP